MLQINEFAILFFTDNKLSCFLFFFDFVLLLDNIIIILLIDYYNYLALITVGLW